MSADTPHIPREDELTRPKKKESSQFDLSDAAAIVLLLGVLLVFAGGVAALFSKWGLALSFWPTGTLLLVVSLVLTFKNERRAEEARRDEVRAQLSPDSSTSKYFNRLVDINLENLSAYYVTVKGHANKSFLTSLFVGVAGFVLIGVGVTLTFKDPKSGLTAAILSGGSGVLTEFISAVFFYLYNQTVRQMKGYHDSLLNVQNILLSFKLVDESQEADKSRMIEIMINYLVGPKSHEIPPSDGSARESARCNEGIPPRKLPSIPTDTQDRKET